jgi:hypothetical protein
MLFIERIRRPSMPSTYAAIAARPNWQGAPSPLPLRSPSAG